MWLLALAVPAQGFAAASMFGCGTGDHGSTGMHSHAMGMHEHSHSAQTPPHSHDADETDAHSGHPHEMTADLGHGHLKAQGASGKVTKGSCSACASCCMGAALPTTVVSFEATPVADLFTTFDLRSVVVFVTEGPERPPRSILV